MNKKFCLIADMLNEAEDTINSYENLPTRNSPRTLVSSTPEDTSTEDTKPLFSMTKMRDHMSSKDYKLKETANAAAGLSGYESLPTRVRTLKSTGTPKKKKTKKNGNDKVDRLGIVKNTNAKR